MSQRRSSARGTPATGSTRATSRGSVRGLQLPDGRRLVQTGLDPNTSRTRDSALGRTRSESWPMIGTGH
jgi:hypothetical protein